MHVPTGAHHSPREVWGQETGWSHLWNWMKKETEVEQPAPAWVPTAHRLEGWASMRYVRDIFPEGDLRSWGDSSAKKLEIYRREFCQRSFREHVARGRDREWVQCVGLRVEGGRRKDICKCTQTCPTKQTGIGQRSPRQRAPAARLK